MSYVYEREKPEVLKPDGQRMLLEMQQKAMELITKAGAVRMDKLMSPGDSWTQLACADHLIEMGQLVEVPTNGMAQHRIFTTK